MSYLSGTNIYLRAIEPEDPTTTNDDYFKKNERNNRNGRFVRDRPTSRKRSGRYSYSAGSSKERFRQ